MKEKRDTSVALQTLIAQVLLCVSTAGIASSFEECFLDADVLEINATEGLNEIDTLSVKIVSLNNEKSYLCPYQVGHQILIEEVEIGDINVSDIYPRSSLKLRSLSYSAMGESGPISGITWQILELTQPYDGTVK